MTSPTKAQISGLYAVTPDEELTESLLEKVRLAISGGAKIVQYRNKGENEVTKLWQASALASMTKSHDVTFIVNDSVALARSANADGVHLGKGDVDIATARKALPNKLIGVSCYNDIDLAVAAEKAGADYVAFGAAFTSTTKPDAVYAALDLYKAAKQTLSIPVVAIGGITITNAHTLVQAGVDAIAMISGLFDTPDIRTTAEYFSNLFKKV